MYVVANNDNFFVSATQFDVPVYIFHGAHDYMVSYTLALSAEDCDAVVGYLSALGKSEAAFERALRTGVDETSASVALNVTPAEQAAFLSYLKENGLGGAQGEVTLTVRLTVRG